MHITGNKLIDMIRMLMNIVVRSFSLAFLSLLLLLNLIFTSYVEYNNSEKVHIEKEFPFLYLVIAVGLFFSLYFAIKYCKLEERKLNIFLAGFYLVAGIFLICNIDGTLRADAKAVHEAAQLFSIGDFSELAEGGYLFHRAIQLGITTYDRILGIISFDPRFIFLVNLWMVLGINYLCYRVTDLVFDHNREVNCLTIILSYMFLPQFFFITFAYGLIPGFLCFMLALYLLQKYFHYHQKKQVVLALIFIALACVLKSNYLIGAIALGLECLVKCVEKRKLSLLLMCVMMGLTPLGAQKILTVAYEQESGMKVNGGEPKITYVAMGINPMNESVGPGWYDGCNWAWYEDTGFDKALTEQKAIECIQNCVKIYKEDPKRALTFFARKTASMWCEPMYQSVWSGPREDTGQEVRTSLLQSLYNGGTVERIVCVCMKSYMLLLYGTAIGYLLIKRRKEIAINSIFIYFIGGVLFHMIWEAKSQYVYTYVFLLIPVCAYMIHILIHKIRR